MASSEPAPAARPEMQWPADAVVLVREAPVRMGPLTIEPAKRRVLHDDGREAFLQPRVMQALVALVRAGGEVLSRDDLMARCWNGVIVGEDAINRVMVRLRQLSEGPGAGVFRVETITKVGYRLITEGSAALATTVAIPANAAQAEPRLAVLAFDNLSGDQDMAYFSDGVSAEILDTVARGSNLSVIAPSSSFQFHGPNKVVRRVAADLKATHLLDGSVRRAGSRVRISAQLIECASETMLWTDRFDRELSDVFALQDEIAEAVASALKVALAPAAKPSVITPETYEAYLQAQPQVHRDLYLADEAAVPLLERVVADAPTFAAAWENLAVARAKLLRAGAATQPYEEARAGVVSAAETALRLDPSRGRAYLALAFLEPWAAYARREAAFDRALAANDNDALLMVWRAWHFNVVGRSRAALDQAQKAAALDPLVPFGRTMIAGALAQLGRYQECLGLWDDWMREGHGIYLSGALVHAAIAADWQRLDGYEALLPPGEPISLTPTGDRQLRRLISTLRANDRQAMLSSLARARAVVQETGSLPLNGFTQLTLFGLRNEALELVEAASFDHMFRPNGPLPITAFGPNVIFEPYRDGGLPQDPRFLRLCAKLGLLSYWLETGVWPDCADQVPYDFRAEARNVAAEGLARHV